jgi:hypothetical protein
MTDELRKRLARLREIAPRLNSATDQSSQLVAMVENLLVDELHIGISAESAEFNSWPAGQDEEGKSLAVRQTLAFGRVGTTYRIHVVDETGLVDDDGSWRELVSRNQTPWPSCNRETKLRAIERLPELLDSIISAAERLAETADETASRIDAMIGDTRDALETVDATPRSWTSPTRVDNKAKVGAPEFAPRILKCPSCEEKGQWLNVGSSHWGVCTDCEMKWYIGANLLPTWQTETQEDWKRNARLLASYGEDE